MASILLNLLNVRSTSADDPSEVLICASTAGLPTFSALKRGDYIRKSTGFDVFCPFYLLLKFLCLTRISALFAPFALLPFLVALVITIVYNSENESVLHYYTPNILMLFFFGTSKNSLDMGVLDVSFLATFLLVFSPDASSAIDLEGRRLTIVTELAAPFMFRTGDSESNYVYTGQCKDLLDELAVAMNFTYHIYTLNNGIYGAKNASGHWIGMVGELVRHKADFAATDLTINSPRSAVIKYSVPFMNVDLGFIYKKKTATFDFFAFLLPFSTPVWIVIAASLIVTSLSLFLFSKVFKADDDPLENLPACFYFGIACLFAQGPETYPRSAFSRATAISWWFFSLMVVTLYTASLTSMLTINRASVSIKSIEDLLNYEEYSFAIKPNGIVQRLFEESEYAPFQVMFNTMIRNKDSSFYSGPDGLEKTRNTDKFAFIRESPYLEYDITFPPCNLEFVLSPNSPKTGTGLAFGFPYDSELTKYVSIEFLKMFANGKMANIHAKWFRANSECKQQTESGNTANAIDFAEIRGIFYTFLVGMAIAFFFFSLKVAQTYIGDKLAEKKSGNKNIKSETKEVQDPTIMCSTGTSFNGEKQLPQTVPPPAVSKDETYNNFHGTGGLVRVKSAETRPSSVNHMYPGVPSY